MKRPMAVSEVILEFLDEELRENALRALGNFLLDVSLSLSLFGFLCLGLSFYLFPS